MDEVVFPLEALDASRGRVVAGAAVIAQGHFGDAVAVDLGRLLGSAARRVSAGADVTVKSARVRLRFHILAQTVARLGEE